MKIIGVAKNREEFHYCDFTLREKIGQWDP